MLIKLRQRNGQTAVEYLFLLGVVVAIVLIGFRTKLPRAKDAANLYFERTVVGILGAPPSCGDGVCEGPPFENATNCCSDCGPGCTFVNGDPIPNF